MTFAVPAWLWVLALVPAVVLLDLWTLRRDRARLAVFASRPLWERLVRRPWSGWRAVRLGLIVLALAGLCLALARPQWGIVREKIEREGVDVVLVLDTSASMLTEDVPPNRFFLARQALSQLVSRLEGDRFALLAFEGEAYPLVPLTLDAARVRGRSLSARAADARRRRRRPVLGDDGTGGRTGTGDVGRAGPRAGSDALHGQGAAQQGHGSRVGR
jgi:hypothetical protein